MKFNAVSLFSSAGIAETYFEKHGINVVAASELLPERAKIYSHLYPKSKMFQGDLTDKKLFFELMDYCKSKNVILLLPHLHAKA